MQIDAARDQARDQMVRQQVRAWDVLDQRVLDTLRQIPRERFVPARYRELAYADTGIPLAHGQHMLAPKLVGRILQALQLTPADRVLEIGTGSGFLSACMAALAGEVRSLEIHADLADSAARRWPVAASTTSGFSLATASLRWMRSAPRVMTPSC